MTLPTHPDVGPFGPEPEEPGGGWGGVTKDGVLPRHTDTVPGGRGSWTC